MANELREWKPSRPALARLARILRQGMGGAEELLPESRYVYDMLGLPAVATTAERLGYGDRLTKGRGQTLQMLPETAETAMFGLDVAPLARAGARLASRGALRASDAATRDVLNDLERETLAKKGYEFGDYMTTEERQQLQRMWDAIMSGDEGFASGGLVSADYDPARVASLADDLSRELALV